MNAPAILSAILLAASTSATALEQNEAAPNCDAKLASAQSFNIKSYHGKVVLVDFWATWCPPCLKSIPFFNHLYQQLSKDQFEIIAINVDEDDDTLQQFLNEHSVNYPIALDPQGKCPNSFGVKAMPSSYIIDKQGVVRHIHLGYRDEDQTSIQNEIDQLIKQ
ncbi:TlpA family protein disulfide reductase [Methylomonas rosea]|uniref:TlpA family protein disulfide reductase n=1 Tax=Methylomonas rosea TaxID=2952227 RepID=A0ABT1TRA8_9GAMM|nr:TlpA disulfide reductase family protein [Methylomonas sp. WSC-7]MCQ8117264.1 TlpA family protein disulfide reductase [Methylomonas sp. WSC-7]